MNLLEHVEQSTRARKLFSPGQRILVAVSGGLDSVILLHLLCALAVKHRWKLTVVHLNHQLRGRASDGDEQFVRKLAGHLKVPCVADRADVRAYAKRSRLSVEMAARAVRHQFLARTANRRRCSCVALAHHTDDQIELFFLRLLRGAGGEGLGGMKWRSPSPADAAVQLVRPLLDLNRADLEQFAHDRRIRFREDVTNASPDALRNRIRHELLPLLRRRFQPALKQTVLRTMDIIGAEAETVTEAARAWLTLKPRAMSDLPAALQRRIIQLQLRHAGIAADYDMIESLRLHPHKRICVSPGVMIERVPSGRLRQVTTSAPGAFNSAKTTLTLCGRAGKQSFGGVRFHWQLAVNQRAFRPRSKSGREFFDADRVGYTIVLRYWQPGDRFQPMGMPVAVKLQDWFTNRKINRKQRHELVVATTASGEIIWVENQRIGERYKLTPRTKRRLIWRWNRPKSCVAVARRAC